MQFSSVFPTLLLASAFVENYRARKFVFLDPENVATPLTCRTGKPHALRRRGGLIRPVYSLLVEVLLRTPALATASISQVSKLRAGVMFSEFFALKGKVLTPLFSISFKDSPDFMSVVSLTPPQGGCPLAEDDLALLHACAIPK